MSLDLSMLENLKEMFKVRLKRFGLLGLHAPDEIINEVVVRLNKAIKSGKQILCQKGWSIKTGNRYIWELYRKRNRYQTVEPYTLESLLVSEHSDLTLEDNKELYKLLHEALQELKPKDLELLELRFFENLSWKQIAQRLADRGEILRLSTNTPRKRGERAVKRLREAFLKKSL